VEQLETVEGRTVAGGNKQRDFFSKEDASSQTESGVLTCVIDAKEERDVAAIDIPNAFIQTGVEDEKEMAVIKLCGVDSGHTGRDRPDIYKS
jgi:hypothetical protein